MQGSATGASRASRASGSITTATARLAAFLSHKPHTRLLETLVADIAVLSFREWPALESLTLSVYKPKIRPGTKRVGVSLDWTRGDYLRWTGAAGQF